MTKFGRFGNYGILILEAEVLNQEPMLAFIGENRSGLPSRVGEVLPLLGKGMREGLTRAVRSR